MLPDMIIHKLTKTVTASAIIDVDEMVNVWLLDWAFPLVAGRNNGTG